MLIACMIDMPAAVTTSSRPVPGVAPISIILQPQRFPLRIRDRINTVKILVTL
ncbi:hypothetical protein [Falsirhodobacter sp. 1013]|uniref:hypothetical protein n=1 Tax=Falsirhodobacter sp. 1013 TaxID=3417566 RepID=UPI003EB6C2AB